MKKKKDYASTTRQWLGEPEKQIKTAPTEQTRSIPRAAGRQKQKSIRSPRRRRAWQRWLYMSWTSLDGVLAVVALPS